MSKGFGSKIKSIIGFDDDYDEMEDAYEEDNAAPEEPERPEYSQNYSASAREHTRMRESSARQERKLIEMNQRGKMKLIVNEPAAFDDCSKIVDNLKNNKPVIINLEKIDTDIAKRIFDFVSGATYALDGSVQKVANNIFVFAPETVDISSNIEEYANLSKESIFK